MMQNWCFITSAGNIGISIFVKLSFFASGCIHQFLSAYCEKHLYLKKFELQRLRCKFLSALLLFLFTYVYIVFLLQKCMWLSHSL